jgi:hypothetical protein
MNKTIQNTKVYRSIVSTNERDRCEKKEETFKFGNERISRMLASAIAHTVKVKSRLKNSMKKR